MITNIISIAITSFLNQVFFNANFSQLSAPKKLDFSRFNISFGIILTIFVGYSLFTYFNPDSISQFVFAFFIPAALSFLFLIFAIFYIKKFGSDIISEFLLKTNGEQNYTFTRKDWILMLPTLIFSSLNYIIPIIVNKLSIWIIILICSIGLLFTIARIVLRSKFKFGIYLGIVTDLFFLMAISILFFK